MYATAMTMPGAFGPLDWVGPRATYALNSGEDAAGFFDSIWKGIKKVGGYIKKGVAYAAPVLNIVKSAVANVPGFGTAISGAIGGLQGLAAGKRWSDVLLDAAQSAIPGGPLGQGLFGAARGAIGGLVSGQGWKGALSQGLGGGLGGALGGGSIGDLVGKVGSGLVGAGLGALGGGSRPATRAPAPPPPPQRARIHVPGRTLPGALTPGAIKVAQALLDRPELRALRPGPLASRLGTTVPVVMEAQAALLTLMRTNKLGPGDTREVVAMTTNEVIALGGRPSAPVNSARVAARSSDASGPDERPHRSGRRSRAFLPLRARGLGRLMALVPAMAGLPRPHLMMLTHGHNPDAAGFDPSDGQYWIVVAGEWPAAITTKITGSAALTSKLLKVNAPGYPGGLQREIVNGNFKYLNAGDRLLLPPEFAPYLKAPAPVPSPGGVPPVLGEPVPLPNGGYGVPPAPGPVAPSGASDAATVMNADALLAGWAKTYPGDADMAPPFGSMPGDIAPTQNQRSTTITQRYQIWANNPPGGDPALNDPLREDGLIDGPTVQSLQRVVGKILAAPAAPSPGVPPAPGLPPAQDEPAKPQDVPALPFPSFPGLPGVPGWPGPVEPPAGPPNDPSPGLPGVPGWPVPPLPVPAPPPPVPPSPAPAEKKSSLLPLAVSAAIALLS